MTPFPRNTLEGCFWNVIISEKESEITLHKNEVFHLGFLQQMWPNPQFSVSYLPKKTSMFVQY